MAVTAARQLFAQDAEETFPTMSLVSITPPSIVTFPTSSTILYPAKNTTTTCTEPTTTTTCTDSTTTTSSTVLYESTQIPTICRESTYGVIYVTETVTETDTITMTSASAYHNGGPILILPPPACAAPTMPLPSAGGYPESSFFASSVYYSTPQPMTSTVRATVKTRQLITDPGPAITFHPHPHPPSDKPKGHTTTTEKPVDLGQLITSAFNPAVTAQGAHAGKGPAPGANVNRVPVTVGPNGVVIGSHTFPAAASTTNVQTIDGQKYTILPSSSGVIVPGGMTITAVPEGPSGAPALQYAAETVDGIPFDLGQSQVVIDGHTIPIGGGASPTSLVINGETVSFGSFGVGFPTTTLSPYGGDNIFTADGAVISFGPGDVVIDGTTYELSHSTDVVVGSETIAIGTNGVGLASTTIAAPTASTGADDESTAAAMLARLSWWHLAPIILYAL